MKLFYSVVMGKNYFLMMCGIVSALFLSCKQEEPLPVVSEAVELPSVADVFRSEFNSVYSEYRSLSEENASQGNRDIVFSGLTPLWDRATIETLSSVRVISVPFDANRQYTRVSEGLEREDLLRYRDKVSRTMLLRVESLAGESVHRSFFMTYVPTKEWLLLEKDYPKIPGAIPELFSGEIIIYSLSGIREQVVVVVNGVVRSVYHYKPKEKLRSSVYGDEAGKGWVNPVLGMECERYFVSKIYWTAVQNKDIMVETFKDASLLMGIEVLSGSFDLYELRCVQNTVTYKGDMMSIDSSFDVDQWLKQTMGWQSRFFETEMVLVGSIGSSGAGGRTTPPKVVEKLSFTQSDIKQIYDKLIKNSKFATRIHDGFNKHSAGNLLLDVKSLGSQQTYARTYHAGTRSPNGQLQPYNVEIVFNSDVIKGLPDIIIAGVIVHEMKHADIFNDMLASGVDISKISRGQILSNGVFAQNYPGYFDYYNRTQNLSATHHRMFSEVYVQDFVAALRAYDPNYSQTEYEAIVYAGLTETEVWQKLSVEKRKLYEDTFKQLRNRGK